MLDSSVVCVSEHVSSSKRSYPKHPFPFLLGEYTYPESSTQNMYQALNKSERQVLSHLKQGARILFDIERRRALVYSFRRGIEHIAELSVRTLGHLVRQGVLVVAGREGRLIHYALH